jgi:hypothetical protein
MNDQLSLASSDVPQGHLIIAGITRACFNAGNIAVTPQVPKGRQNRFLNFGYRTCVCASPLGFPTERGLSQAAADTNADYHQISQYYSPYICRFFPGIEITNPYSGLH